MKLCKTPAFLQDDTLRPAFYVLLTALAVLLRLSLLPVSNGDYTMFLHPWFQEIQLAGGFPALAEPVGDYTPAYLYLLAFLTYLPGYDLYLIKLPSCAVDFLLAFLVMRVVREFRPGPFSEMGAFFLVLFFPPVFLNSAGWGQCDGFYISALTACFLSCLHGKSNRAMLAFGVAFMLKLQAVFFAPFLLLLLLKRRLTWRSVLLVPAVYVASIVPAALLGRDFGELLTIYFRQTGTYPQLCMGIPNLYAFLGDQANEFVSRAGVLLAGAIVVFVLFFLVVRTYPLTKEFYLTAAFFFLFLVPYLLPHMHERYFMPADIFGLFYLFRYPKRFYIPLVLAVVDTLGQANFLFGIDPYNPIQPMSLLVLLVLVLLFGFLLSETGVQFPGKRAKKPQNA